MFFRMSIISCNLRGKQRTGFQNDNDNHTLLTFKNNKCEKHEALNKQVVGASVITTDDDASCFMLTTN